MLKKMCVSTMIAVLFVGAGPASGMDLPTKKWWNNPNLATTLNLTEQEKRLLDAKYVEARRKLIQIKGDIESKRFELELLLEQEPMDDAKVKEQFRGLEDLRANLVREGFYFILETRRLLGVERFRQLKTIHDQFRAKRGPKGEGRELLR